MAGSGYGYTPLPNYPLPQPIYASQPGPAYFVSPQDSTHPTRPAGSHSEAALKGPYNHNRNVIPGLGLGFPNNALDWQDQGTAAGHTSQDASKHPHAHHVVMAKDSASSITASSEKQALPGKRQKESATSDAIEEGEISEGELGDIYEPKDGQGSVVVSRDPQGRERSGSYSPHLSPREVSRNQKVDEQRFSIESSHAPPQAARTTEQMSKFLHVDTVTEARKQAQDAILRLWPLNVRYQDYLNEGINQSLLESLFKDLGFEMVPGKIAQVKSSTKSIVLSQEASMSEGKTTSKISDAKAKPDETTQKQSNSGQKAQLDKTDKPGLTSERDEQDKTDEAASQDIKAKADKSEERKDRIARLLAAKTSKPSSSAPEADSTTTKKQAKTTAKTSSQNGSRSEKLKLLHAKMEALRKAREARGQKRAHPEETEEPVVMPASLSLKSTMTAEDVAIDGSAAQDAEGSRNSGQEKEDTSSGSNSATTPSIPGLFLSSTPQPSPTRTLASGRYSAPVMGDADERPFKRPFGQARESRPFLIDVSDDEDDAEMDIDSPELDHLSFQGPTTPSLGTTTIKAVSSFADHGLTRRFSSPVHTPSGMSDSSARNDLESMNKKIEDMKRKIAEAEARKKAKQSRPQSPASAALNGDGQGSSRSETTGSSQYPILPPPILSPGGSRSPSRPVSEPSVIELAEMPGAQHQHADVKQRSLSRTANKRLPLVEARRREQQLKLKLLQSQMASIEREIQESLQEEELLKEDADSVKSGDEENGEPASGESSTPPKASDAGSSADAMDTSSESGSSDDIERNTPGPVQPSGDEHMASTSADVIEPLDMSSESILDSRVEAITRRTLAVHEEAETAGLEGTVASMGGPLDRSSDESQEVAIQEQGHSHDGDLEDASDSYEPPEADSSGSSSDHGRASRPASPVVQRCADDLVEKDTIITSSGPLIDQASVTVKQGLASGGPREAEHTEEEEEQSPASEKGSSGFQPYETPLQYFHAYRFHPEFSKSISGGLRSLTYSNKIDAKKVLCPDEVGGRICPRGKQCEYQHFETIQAPDDQILLQLGAYGNGDEKHRQEYNQGLRQLLIDFRNNKVKDFQTISRGIIEYRARFLGDKSKILPLGNVSI